MTRYYISEQGAKKLPEYKYSGSDASLLYKYVISPSAQFLVDHIIPPWIAPNVITVFGLSLVASSHIITAIYSPNFEEEIPGWVNIWNGIALLLYQILDAADGKQARKTGNTSPLGLLFDHGCDAFNCVLSACTYAACIRIGSTNGALGLLIIPTTVFFMATWEELYTGTLALPIVNGPNEGLFTMYSVYIYTGIFGTDTWTKPSFIFGRPLNQVFLGLTALAAVVTTGSNVLNVRKSIHDKGKSSFSAIIGLTPYVFLVMLAMTWFALSPNDVVQTNPRLLMWTLGLLFCKLVMHMMLAHLCNEPVQLLRKTLIVMFAVAFLLVAGIVPFADEDVIAQGLFILALLPYVHMVYFVIQEITTILGIHCFRVKDSKKNK